MADSVEKVPNVGAAKISSMQTNIYDRLLLACPFRKSYPRVAMMQPRQNGRGGNGSVPLNRSTQRRILVQR
jgi:hypothetical protein